jgi:hypothetical protein
MNGSPVARRHPALGEGGRRARRETRGGGLSRARRAPDARACAPLPFSSGTANDGTHSDMAMQGIDVFLDTYVRLDEGTAVLLCAHRSCVRTAAWLYAALVTRGAAAETFLFDGDDAEAEKAVATSLAALRALPHVRRVAVLVCEPGGPSFRRPLEVAQGDKPEKTPIFRVSGRTSGIFELGFGASPEHGLEGDLDGLSQADIDELLAECDTELGRLDDHEIEEIASICEEEIGTLSDEELAALTELEDSELLELCSTWGEEGFRVLA